MRNWIWIPLAGLVGIVVGSWGPREDLALLKERAHAAQANRRVSGTAGFDAFARLASIPDVATNRVNPKTGTVAARTAPTNAVASAAEETSASNAPAARPEGRARRPRLSREDLRARIDEAVELWNTRVDIAKAQWKERLGVSGEGEGAFDSALASMNESLRETMQAMADEIEAAGKLTPEMSLRMMGDVTRTMAETYDAIGEAVSDDRRGEVSEMQVFEFIDPSVAEPLIGVQDKVQDGIGGFRR